MREEKEFINGYNQKNIMNVKLILRLFLHMNHKSI